MQDAFERPISGRPVQEIERAAGTDPAFFQDTVIPAGAAGFLNAPGHADCLEALVRSEEHTSELQSLMRNSFAVFCIPYNVPLGTGINIVINIKLVKQII